MKGNSDVIETFFSQNVSPKLLKITFSTKKLSFFSSTALTMKNRGFLGRPAHFSLPKEQS